MGSRSLAIVFLSAALPAAAALEAQAPAPPPQPETGPGGKQAPFAGFTSQRVGSGALEYLLFEPADPTPASAPVVAFLHGWGAIDPYPYGRWITHIVKRGAVVIYPLYQADLATPTDEFTPNAISAIRTALTALATEPGHVRPDPGQFALVGHSEGGLLVANIAALAASSGLPIPKAVFSVEAGKSRSVFPWVATPMEDLSLVDPNTLLVTLDGDSDDLAGPGDAVRIFNETVGVPAANKNLVTLVSDAHGLPALVADHVAPCAPQALPVPPAPAPTRGVRAVPPRGGATPPGLGAGTFSIDALDFYATWKIFDGLTDAAFFARNREYALGDTPQQTFMGLWSDGVPVAPLKVTIRTQR